MAWTISYWLRQIGLWCACLTEACILQFLKKQINTLSADIAVPQEPWICRHHLQASLPQYSCRWVEVCALRWRHNDHDSVSNYQPHGCLLNRLFRRRSKKTSKFRVTGLCVGNSPGPVNSPHKGPITRKMFPFDDVIMGFWVTSFACRPYWTFLLPDF